MFGHIEASGSELRPPSAKAAWDAQGDPLLDLACVDCSDNDGLGAVMFQFKQLAVHCRRPGAVH